MTQTTLFPVANTCSDCECDRCLMTAMLQREPSEIIFRAWEHLIADPYQDREPITLLQFLEHKLEVQA